MSKITWSKIRLVIPNIKPAEDFHSSRGIKHSIFRRQSNARIKRALKEIENEIAYS